jgi:hypothetical protein
MSNGETPNWEDLIIERSAVLIHCHSPTIAIELG